MRAEALLSDQSKGQETRAGCRCADSWAYGQNKYEGTCEDPESDPGGPWCFVDARTCMRQPHGQNATAGAWDYCRKKVEATTRNGCTCKIVWTLFDRQSNNIVGGCGNPDQDPLGARPGPVESSVDVMSSVLI